MLKKTLIAFATTAFLAAGQTAASAAGPHPGPGPGPGPVHGPQHRPGPVHGPQHGPGPAGGIYFGGPGWSIGFGTPGFHRVPPPRRVCQPVFKRVAYRHHGHLKFRVIKVGQRCHWVYPNRGPKRGPKPGWGWAW